jgi:Peptidase family M28
MFQATFGQSFLPRGVRTALILAALASSVPLQQPRADPASRPGAEAVRLSASRIEADVRFLADDLLEGREAGTRGYDLAALYVATQYRMMGLEPAGDAGTYFQAVPMLSATRIAEAARFALTRDGQTTELRFKDEFLPGLDFNGGACELTAPMVFVGQAVHAPELKQDDFAGVDLRGKVAVILANAPARFPNDQRAYHADGTQKLGELERRGAVGVIFLGDPESESKYPWDFIASNWQRPGMRLLGPDGKPLETYPGLRCMARVPASKATLLLAGARYTPAQVFKRMAKDTLRPFELQGTVTLASRSKLEPVTSRNVVGKVPAGASADGGAAPALAGEHVLLTAHLDHVGIGTAIDGDSIYNGAQDNAVGIAAMLEAGRLLMQSRDTMQRSVLLLATTAEEKGLLGADHFAAHPTVPLASIVANVNLDMPTHLAPVTDVIPYGIEHSTLDTVAKAAVEAAGLTLTPDPFPDEVIFIRSDQYSFIRKGVPAVYLGAGITRADGSDGLAAFGAFLRQHYHKPSDDLSQPIDWNGAAQLALVNRNIAYAIATQENRPAWKPGDFFGDRFGAQKAR